MNKQERFDIEGNLRMIYNYRVNGSLKSLEFYNENGHLFQIDYYNKKKNLTCSKKYINNKLSKIDYYLKINIFKKIKIKITL